MNGSAPRIFGFVCVLLVGTIVMSGAAFAQTGEAQTTPRIRWGRVGIAPSIEVRDIGIDTNVYNEGLQPTKDFTFTVAPLVTATLPTRRATLTLRSATDFIYFVKQGSERAVNEDLRFSTRFTLGRLTPFVNVGYVNTRQRLTEEIDARARRIERNGGVGLEVAIGRKLNVGVRGDLWRMTFDSDAVFDDRSLSQELDRESTTFSGSARFALTALTTLVASTEASGTRFKQTSLRNTDTRQALFGIDVQPAARLSGSVRAGFQSFKPRVSTVPDFSGLVGAGTLAYRIGPLTTLSGSYERNVAFSYLAEEPYYVRHGFALSMVRRLTPLWDVTFSGQRSWHRYRRTLVAPGESASGHEERILVGIFAVGYDLGPRTRISTGASFTNRRSDLLDLSNRSYSGFRVGATLAYGF